MAMIVNPFGTFGSGGGDPNFASVVLLLHCNGSNGSTTITDSSGSPAVCGAQGNAQISTAHSKFGGASLLLDGAGDHVTTDKAQSVQGGEFTLESFVRCTSAQTGRIVSSQALGTPNAVLALRVDAAGSITLLLRSSGGSGLVVLSSATGLVSTNNSAWHHIAATRDGSGLINLWLDGSSVANTTSTTNPSDAVVWMVGSQYGADEFFAGYLDEVRITEGVCRYNDTFTPPPAPFPDQ